MDAVMLPFLFFFYFPCSTPPFYITAATASCRTVHAFMQCKIQSNLIKKIMSDGSAWPRSYCRCSDKRGTASSSRVSSRCFVEPSKRRICNWTIILTIRSVLCRDRFYSSRLESLAGVQSYKASSRCDMCPSCNVRGKRQQGFHGIRHIERSP